MQETWVQSLGWEDVLEDEVQPLQYSCLIDTMDRGLWWAMVRGVATCQTQLSKRPCMNIYRMLPPLSWLFPLHFMAFSR